MNGDITQGGDGIITDALVEANIIYDNGVAGGSGINCDGVQDSLIHNNLIYDEHASGISLYQIDGGGPSTGNRVLNNTVTRSPPTGAGRSTSRTARRTRPRATTFCGTTIRSAAASTSATDSLPGFTDDNNAVMDRFTTDGGDTILTLAEWQQQSGQDAHSLLATPDQLFVDAAGNDYQLSATSPAIDTGETRADVPTDILGVTRPQGAGFDIGAYERPAGDEIFADGFDSIRCSALLRPGAPGSGICVHRPARAHALDRKPPLQTSVR